MPFLSAEGSPLTLAPPSPPSPQIPRQRPPQYPPIYTEIIPGLSENDYDRFAELAELWRADPTGYLPDALDLAHCNPYKASRTVWRTEIDPADADKIIVTPLSAGEYNILKAAAGIARSRLVSRIAVDTTIHNAAIPAPSLRDAILRDPVFRARRSLWSATPNATERFLGMQSRLLAVTAGYLAVVGIRV
jgi:hypothetical protein